MLEIRDVLDRARQRERDPQQDILDAIEAAAGSIGYIIASCEPIPASNEPGDNPPHAKAAARYREIAPSGFLVTQEHADRKCPQPIVFILGDRGFVYQKPETSTAEAARSLSASIAEARGGHEPPKDRVGFGQWP